VVVNLFCIGTLLNLLDNLYTLTMHQARNQRGAIGQLPPEIFKTVCIC